jgi:glycosyltransferase involved in cell wall biosynthesis
VAEGFGIMMGLRVLGLTQGNVDDPLAASGLNKNVFGACAQRMALAGVLDISLSGLERYWNALYNWRPDRDIWRERFDLNVWSFRRLSAKAGRELAQRRDTFDVVLQLRALFAPGWPIGAWPYTLLVDNTYTLSDRYYRPWAPMNPQDKQQWLGMERETYQRAAFVFARTNWVRRSLIEDYGLPPERAVWVGTGSHFGLNGGYKPKTPTGEKIILFVGKETRRKGATTLLQAFKKVRLRVPEAQLLLIGREMAVSQEGVTALGKVTDRQHMQHIYEKASVFVLPALFEPCGNAVAEAMAYQLPVIVSEAGGLTEFVQEGHNGYIVQPEQVDQLAERLVDLLKDDEKCIEMGRNGLERVREVFNWDAVISRMAPYLEQAARMSGQNG